MKTATLKEDDIIGPYSVWPRQIDDAEGGQQS